MSPSVVGKARMSKGSGVTLPFENVMLGCRGAYLRTHLPVASVRPSCCMRQK
jgi:hypothetical protein